MFLADYHMHSFPFSPDARDTMLDMARAACSRGMTHICITNHLENCSQTPACPQQFPPMREYEGLLASFNHAKNLMGGSIDMRLGAEVGGPNFSPAEGREIYENPIFDFIIGSIHNLRNSDDFYYMDYHSLNNFNQLIEEYLTEYVDMAKSKLCDVLGHIGYMHKYMARQGVFFDMMDFSDLLTEVFRACVDNGVGIEVNTSSLRDKYGHFVPDRGALELYRDLGGEIITVGSDSHTSTNAGRGVAEAFQLLRELGFKYVALFKAHVPEFIKI